MSASESNSERFGANEWLVDEMYERFQQDPNSVEPSWIEFFKTYTPGSNGTSSNGAASNGASSNGAASNGTSAATSHGAIPTAPRGGVPPMPKSATSAPSVPTPTQVIANEVSAAPVVAAAPAPVTPAPSQVATPTTSAPQQVVRTTSSNPTPTPADPVVRPAPVLITPGAARIEVLRGVASRVVKSMEDSLTVPTATSVRAIPAKLMIDNRIVINNHLKRGRGGKVSFTHLIGYAMIKALRAMPEMNAFFTEQEGKPAIGFPEHINLGIAIDLAKADGSRQLLVPSIKGCEELDFAQFWSEYEAVVAKARAVSLTVADFA